MSQIILNSSCSFNNFLINNTNQLVLLAALSVSQEPIKYSPTFFYGKSGSGKTHLLQAILKRFKEIHNKPALYVTADEFCRDAIFAIRNKEQQIFKDKYRNNELLIIDDFQLIADKPITQKELLIVLKEFQINNCSIIIAADQHPYWISGLDSDLAESCHGGLMFEIK